VSLASGAIFAGYTVVRLLGSGGMGEVYLVEHPRLPRRDALKILPAEVSADGEFRERFLREADLASTLFHPHIVGVHDRGEFDGQLWISMDYVDGTDASHLLRDRYPAGMPADEVLQIVTAVASALDYAHWRGLLHRDVKPANILIADLGEEERRILLGDFGIARQIAEISGLTATNLTVGTVAYSAPEQLMGLDLDGRADQYALAATAHHLLTGCQLFPQSNPVVVISQHLNSPPPTLATHRLDLAALDPVLAKALAKDPADRFERCTEFAKALSGATTNNLMANESTQASATMPAPAAAAAALRSGALDQPVRRASWARARVIGPMIAAVLVVIAAAAFVTAHVVGTKNATAPGVNTPATSSTAAPTSAPTAALGPTSSPSVTAPPVSTPGGGNPNPTIFSYIQQNGIVETPVHRGDPGAPIVNLPMPAGWVDAGKDTPDWAYSAIVYTGQAASQYTPSIVVVESKLTGSVDPQRIIDLAAGELHNLNGFQPTNAGNRSTLDGYEAYQLGGTWVQDGQTKLVAQKTVVIPEQGAVYVFQLNTDGLENQMDMVNTATTVVDDQTTITT
jgi:serine/threonine protein kinase, bacterial